MIELLVLPRGGRTSQDEIFNKAAKYLDKNQRWVRSEMENIEGLQGVWDELNNYEYVKLKNRHELKEKSKAFESIVILFEHLHSQDKLADLKGTYCEECDEVISLEKYKKKLNVNSCHTGQGTKQKQESGENRRTELGGM